MIEFLEKQDIRLTVVDGGEIIREAGSARSLNAALIAAACASGAVPFSVEEIENVVRNELKAEYAESNLRAIAAGAPFSDKSRGIGNNGLGSGQIVEIVLPIIG